MTRATLRVIACLLGSLLLLIGCQQQEAVSLGSLDRMVRQGRGEEALQVVREALDRDPTRRDLQLGYGRLLIDRRDYHLALWPLREAAQDAVFGPRALHLLAQTQLMIGNHEEALGAIERLLEAEPENQAALRLRANANLASMRLEEALVDADRLLDAEPGDLETRLVRLRAFLLLERADEAGEALEALEKQLTEEPDDHPTELQARVCAARAVFQREKRDPDGWYETAVACAGRFPSQHVALQQALEAHAARGEWDESVELIETALEESPDDGRIRYLLADYHGRLGEPEIGETLLREGIDRFDPPRSQDWRSLYEFYWQLGRSAEALEALERSIELIPNPSTADLLQLADALIEAEKPERAGEVSERLGEGYRDLVVGRIKLAEGDLAGARASLLAGVRVWPNNSIARVLLGRVAARSGDLEEAVNQYIEAYRIDHAHNSQGSEVTDAAKEIARIQTALGAYEQAAEFASNHVAAKPQDFEGHELKARAGARSGSPGFVSSALDDMSKLAGGMARAVALQGELVSQVSGPAVAIEAMRRWKPDLKLPANARVLDVFLAQLSLLDQHEEAIRSIELAVDAAPDSAEFHALHARTLMEASRPPEEARKSIEEALRLDSEQQLALLALGDLERTDGDVDAALVAYERAAGIEGPLSARAALAAGRLLAEAVNRQQNARARLMSLLEDHPLESRAATSLAELALADEEAPEFDDALGWALRAVQFSGALPLADASQAFEVLARVRVARGETDQAKEALSAALELDPGNASASSLSRQVADAAEVPEAAKVPSGIEAAKSGGA